MNNYIIEAKLLDVDEEAQSVFKRFGRSTSGDISRTFLVRGDMPLWALHYALTAAFGFLNEHLHKFLLLEEDLERVCQGKTSLWLEEVGRLFKSPLRDGNDDFFADDYVRGSFRNWRRKKYSPPFVCKSRYLTLSDCQDEMSDFIARADDCFYVNPHGYVIPKRALESVEPDMAFMPFKEIPFSSLNFMFEYDAFELLETLTVEDVATWFGRLEYRYDYGDGWRFGLCFERSNLPQAKELTRPRMLSVDGYNLVEDVGGVYGFVAMLLTLFNVKPIDGEVAEEGKEYVRLHDGLYEYVDPNFTSKRLGFSPKQMMGWAESLEWSMLFPTLKDWF